MRAQTKDRFCGSQVPGHRSNPVHVSRIKSEMSSLCPALADLSSEVLEPCWRCPLPLRGIKKANKQYIQTASRTSGLCNSTFSLSSAFHLSSIRSHTFLQSSRELDQTLKAISLFCTPTLWPTTDWTPQWWGTHCFGQLFYFPSLS